jgi:hypothetical protein
MAATWWEFVLFVSLSKLAFQESVNFFFSFSFVVLGFELKASQVLYCLSHTFSTVNFFLSSQIGKILMIGKVTFSKSHGRTECVDSYVILATQEVEL